LPVDPVFEIEAQAVARILDELDYFQILKVEPGAKLPDIKAAYFRESRLYHPDQFFGLPAGDFKSAVERIYRRINEAWVCLRDDRRRARYLEDIRGPDRARHLRYTEEDDAAVRQPQEASTGRSTPARKVFQRGLVEMDEGRFAQAVQSFRMALGLEPDNARFRQKLAEAIKAAGPSK